MQIFPRTAEFNEILEGIYQPNNEFAKQLMAFAGRTHMDRKKLLEIKAMGFHVIPDVEEWDYTLNERLKLAAYRRRKETKPRHVEDVA